MQITCPRCKTLLEIPSYVEDYDTLPLECGACHHQFTLQVSRPSLKVKNDKGEVVSPPGNSQLIVSNDFDLASRVTLSETQDVEGYRIEAVYGPVSGITPLSARADERTEGFLSAVARAQNELRERARQIGANGVIGVQVDSVGGDESPALRIQGTAVWLVRE